MSTVKDWAPPARQPRAARVERIAQVAQTPVPAASSIFHEPWWLDIATQGNWQRAIVTQNDKVIGEMPYAMRRTRLWRVSHLPPLTRMLGPVIAPVTGSAARQQRHRLDVTARLIEQLPECDSFFQVFDPRVDDALAFALHGFTVSARYTFRISSHETADEAWARLDSKTRNVIRSASHELTIDADLTPEAFLAFYDANLAARSRTNAYGSTVMRELVSAFVARKAGMLLGAYASNGQLVAAIGIVWDQQAMYYLLSSRTQEAHCGSISLLLWTSICRALDRQLTFDFDGFSGPSTFNFLSGFGATLTQRLGVERLGTMYLLTRTVKRHFAPAHVFAPNL